MLDSKTARHVAVALFAALLMVACGGASNQPADLASSGEQAIKDIATGDITDSLCFTLFAGQTIEAGEVCVSADCEAGELTVSYSTAATDWELDEVHLWVGTDIADMPQTRKGNPKIGNFPYHTSDFDANWTIVIPFAAIGDGVDCGNCLTGGDVILMAAHAVVSKDNGDGTTQTETGWSDGGPITSKGSWATLSTFQLWPDDCSEGPTGGGGGNCETAFAYDATDGTCFLDIDEDNDGNGDFNRWGWSVGPLAGGSYEFDIYAGAGQCDTNKGVLVGTLEVDYDATSGEATVTFVMNAGFTLEETHLYVGSEILPRDVNGDFTVAPGQYPTIHEDLGGASSDTYTITGLSGDIYVVAHGVVCD